MIGLLRTAHFVIWASFSIHEEVPTKHWMLYKMVDTVSGTFGTSAANFQNNKVSQKDTI